MVPGLYLIPINKGNSKLHELMSIHYSAPKGFVGRQLIYQIIFGETSYGAIAAGSATRFLPGRTDFFNCEIPLNNLVNNTFFHLEKQSTKYPSRNFSTQVVALWRETVRQDWQTKYGDLVLGWETLVELPRTGELYRRDGWSEVAVTEGFTCKREAGQGTDSWTGKRVWNTTRLRPKKVFVREVEKNLIKNLFARRNAS